MTPDISQKVFRMNFRLPLLLLGALAATPGLAFAQGAAPAANPNPMGPPIAGICLFGRDGAIANSKAGQATDARLRQLGQGVQAELNPEQQAIIAENNALKVGGANIPALQRDQRIGALQKRATAFTQLQQLRTAQLQATRTQALDQILKPMDQVLGPISTAHHCSVVIERSATYGFNQAMDLTPDVVRQLDVRMPTNTFDLARPESVKR